MNGSREGMAILLIEGETITVTWESISSLRAPGRASGREVTVTRPIRVRPAGRSAGGEWQDARIDVRADARTFEVAGLESSLRADACSSDSDAQHNAGVCHPHGEANGPGAHASRAECANNAFGGTRSPSSWSSNAC